ncbi:MAG: DUF2007 domain-containing protein [Magnetovibrio sp.]|nr:DUF2007 domain-containing protein [Magnetovibrio sp.]
MFELVRTNDPVLISWLQAHLSDAGIEVLVLDEHMSIMDGSVLAIPRRIMVAQKDQFVAKTILAEADRIASGDVDNEGDND